jgi:hypothetical protein
VEFVARHLPFSFPLVSPFGGAPLLVPSGWQPSGLVVRWSGDESVLANHGSLQAPLAVPTTTGTDGAARLGYQVKAEDPGNEQGPTRTEAAMLLASVPVRDLVSHNYAVTPIMEPFLFGERRGTALISIEWHVPPGWKIDGASGGGRIFGQKCGDPPGEWIMDGTYDQLGMQGVQRWTITIAANTDGSTASYTGTYTYTDQAQGRPGGAPVTVYQQGKASGRVTLTFDADRRAIMRLQEEQHSFISWVDPAFKGHDQNAPLIDRTVTWEVGGAC